ncbi:MAG: IclR family transcriptional regulator [Spirochaetota bacterium]
MNKLKTVDIIMEASPILADLMHRSGETVHLAILDKGQVLYLDKREGPQAVGIISRVGQRLPAHCTGLGKVLLAYADQGVLEDVINTVGLPRFTKNTITDYALLREELQKVRSRGYAIDNEEIEEGLCCVSAPVRDYTGKVIAAISISLPAFRFSNDKREEHKNNVIESAEKISRLLGYRGNIKPKSN